MGYRMLAIAALIVVLIMGGGFTMTSHWIISELGVLSVLVLIFGLVLLAVSTVVVHEYERLVVLTFGRFSGERGPGVRFVVPTIQRKLRVDIRQKVADIPAQDIITKDNVLVTVNGVVYYRVVDAEKAILRTEYYQKATTEMAQAMLRTCVGRASLDDLADTHRVGNQIRDAMVMKTKAFGVDVPEVEVKEIKVDPQMVEAISRQATAERERLARVIEAEGELQAAQATAQAAEILMNTKGAMTLRYINALKTVSANPGATVVFPMYDVMDGLSGDAAGKDRAPGFDAVSASILATANRAAAVANGIDAKADHLDHHAHKLEAMAAHMRGHAERHYVNGPADVDVDA